MKTLYVILSCLDLLLTIILISKLGKELEVNFIAKWLYVNFGFIGLASLKMISVSIVIVAERLISLVRPRTGQLVITCGCFFTGMAVLVGLIGCCISQFIYGV